MKKLIILFAFSIIYFTSRAEPLIVKTKYLKECSIKSGECTEYVVRDVFFEFDPADSKTIVITGDGPSAYTFKVIDFEVKKDDRNVVTTTFTCENRIIIIYTCKLDIDYHSIAFSSPQSDNFRVYDSKKQLFAIFRLAFIN